MLKFQGKEITAKTVAVSFGILASLVLLGYYIFPGEPDIPPQDAIIQALNRTMQEQSYEYTVKMSTVIGGKEQLASHVKGERENKNRIHIKGQIFETEVDLYQIDSTTYTKDQLTGEWIKITGNQINQQEIFMAELNPLAGFSYKELNGASFAGMEKVNGKKYWVYEANPTVNNPYLEILWKDFRYRFWLEPRSLRIFRGEVAAVSKNNPSDRLNFQVEFFNYGSSIKIKPPI